MSAIAMPGWQGTSEWHAERRAGLGSSDAPVLTGDAPWGDLLQLYAVKTGIIDPPDIQSAPMAWGLKLEATIAEWFTETTGKKVRRVNHIRRHPDHPWMIASLDRTVVGERWELEIKTARFAGDEWGAVGTSEIPAHYLIQVQHQIAVGGFDGAYLAVLFSGSDPRLYTIQRDEALIAALIDLESEFWACVQSGTPPDAILKRQRPPAIPFRDGEISADPLLAAGIEGVHGLRAEIKQHKADLDAAEEAVKTLLGPNTAARAGAYRATYRQSKDTLKIAWDLIASAYRKRLMYVDSTFDAHAIESLFTSVKAGNRPLLISIKEEALNATA